MHFKVAGANISYERYPDLPEFIKIDGPITEKLVIEVR